MNFKTLLTKDIISSNFKNLNVKFKLLLSLIICASIGFINCTQATNSIDVLIDTFYIVNDIIISSLDEKRLKTCFENADPTLLGKKEKITDNVNKTMDQNEIILESVKLSLHKSQDQNEKEIDFDKDTIDSYLVRKRLLEKFDFDKLITFQKASLQEIRNEEKKTENSQLLIEACKDTMVVMFENVFLKVKITDIYRCKTISSSKILDDLGVVKITKDAVEEALKELEGTIRLILSSDKNLHSDETTFIYTRISSDMKPKLFIIFKNMYKTIFGDIKKSLKRIEFNRRIMDELLTSENKEFFTEILKSYMKKINVYDFIKFRDQEEKMTQMIGLQMQKIIFDDDKNKILLEKFEKKKIINNEEDKSIFLDFTKDMTCRLFVALINTSGSIIIINFDVEDFLKGKEISLEDIKVFDLFIESKLKEQAKESAKLMADHKFISFYTDMMLNYINMMPEGNINVRESTKDDIKK